MKMSEQLMTACALIAGFALAGETPSTPSKPVCEDHIQSVATVVPTLDAPLFHETKTSLKPEIVESDSGSLEDTTDGEIEPADLLRIEHTSDCVSTHQGEHQMELCEAVRDGENIQLKLSGGMPAYASGLSITITPDLNFQCSFSAVYPAPTNNLRWRITKKELRLRSRDFKAGQRLYGWISVTFEETDNGGDPAKIHKVEDYIKPVILHETE